MDNRELRRQLLSCIDGALKDAMYDALGYKINTSTMANMMKELGKLAVDEQVTRKYQSSSQELTGANLTVAWQSRLLQGLRTHKCCFNRASLDLLLVEAPRRSASTQYQQEDKPNS